MFSSEIIVLLTQEILTSFKHCWFRQGIKATILGLENKNLKQRVREIGYFGVISSLTSYCIDEI